MTLFEINKHVMMSCIGRRFLKPDDTGVKGTLPMISMNEINVVATTRVQHNEWLLERMKWYEFNYAFFNAFIDAEVATVIAEHQAY